jgi:type IV pilus assembly protein PilB
MKSLLEKLLEDKIISKKDFDALKEEVEKSNETEEEVLIKSEIVSNDFLYGVKSEIIGIPLRKILNEDISLRALEFVPEDAAKFYKMIPIGIDKNILEVGMVYPEDLKAQEVLNFLSRQNNFSYEVYLISIDSFNDSIKQYQALKKEFSKALEGLETELQGDETETTFENDDLKSRSVSEDAPIIKMVAVILKYAVDGKASDIHIEPFKDKSRVRYRVDGELKSSIILPGKTHPSIVSRIKILSNLKIDETRVPQDGRFKTTVYDKDIDFRVSTFPTSLGEKVVMRVLVSGEAAQSLDSLGLTTNNLRLVQEAIKKPYGLILSTGPTGSGKTTTLYSLLSMLNKENVNIITLEDPIEYFLSGVNHSQVRPDINYGFAEGLRSILRQDPDVIMVGEARDTETASMIIHAALTGHIVLSTLHTNNAIGVIPRLVDMGVESFLIPPALSLMIAQRLVGVLCPDCKVKKESVPEKIKDLIKKELDFISEKDKEEINLSSYELYSAVGCKKCNWRGYKGRIGLYEVLEVTAELAEIINSDFNEDKIWKEAHRQGMVTLRQDGIIKALKGITTMEEIIRVTEEY